ncbi:MAG: phage tail protein [Pseudomonadota bacterium]
MATLILSAVGTLVGGPLGGAIGALIGRQVDAGIIGGRKVEGPRLKELSVQTSSYGSALPLHFGRIQISGTVIWATELAENKEKTGGGKGRPAVTTYSYTASFAVALGSRPIKGIGRIWADGNLLRGEAGDLKVGGKLRVHLGHGDQDADPLLVEAEGAALNPAYRNLAYVVFEDLELADYGNRLPSLTLEVIADDEAVPLDVIVGELVPAASTSGLENSSFKGLTLDQGTAGDILAVLSDVTPLSCSVSDEMLAFGLAERAPARALRVLPFPAAGGDSAEDARANGWSRRREALPGARQCAVRYYDVARDYQPGLQRSIGRSGPGDVSVIELPAAMSASEARSLANVAARRLTLPRDSLRYRVSEIDIGMAPGSIVRTPVIEGDWRIDQWEWQADGVMLDLSAVSPVSPSVSIADSGRSNRATDLLLAPTQIFAFELPWDGSGDGTSAAIRVSATAQTAGWRGATLYAQKHDGTMNLIGSTGRHRTVAGKATSVLPVASPLLLDTGPGVEVELWSSDFSLDSVTWAQLTQGANVAVLGSEIIQFANAEFVSGRTWRISNLLRGRGGTEHAIASHGPGELFSVIDGGLVSIDSSLIADPTTAGIVALGLGDAVPAVSAIHSAGLTLRPLSPVHGQSRRNADNSVTIEWTRRSRGAWAWLDEVDVPLNEPEEAWEVSFESAGVRARIWTTSSTELTVAGALAAELHTTFPDGQFSCARLDGNPVPSRLPSPCRLEPAYLKGPPNERSSKLFVFDASSRPSPVVFRAITKGSHGQ